MLVFKEHFTKNIQKFVEEPSEDFSDIFELLNVHEKERYINLLIYIDKVLNGLLSFGQDGFKYLNLHIEGVDNNLQRVITQFLIIKFFHNSIKSSIESDIFRNKIKEYERILAFRYKETPSYVSGKKLNKKAKQWKAEKDKIKKLLFFYKILLKKYGDKGSLFPCTIFNLLNKEQDFFKEIFITSPFATSIHNIEKEQAYVLLNSEQSLNEIDSIKFLNDQFLFDHLKNIFIVGCETKKISKSFNYNELKGYNQLGNLQNLIVLSFSAEKEGFYKVKSKLERIQSLYYSTPKFPISNSYFVPADEIRILIKNNNSNTNSINFYGNPQCSFWDEFRLMLYEELYELRSIKMMNIYSLALNDELKKLILDEIFSFELPSTLITNETRNQLKELSSDTISKLKSTLNDILTYIAASDWRTYLISKIDNDCTIIIPDGFKNNQCLLLAFQKAVELPPLNQIRSWFNINLSVEASKIIVLDYRDVGRFPYTIQPNIIEFFFGVNSSIECYFINFFYKLKFDWASYNYYNDLIKLLSNDLRFRHFELRQLSQKIKVYKPSKEDNTVWEIENQYESIRSLPTIKVKFLDSTRVKSYHSSELFIVKFRSAPNLSVSRIGNLLEEDSDEAMYIQMLDEIHSEFNIYEKIANKEREEKELRLIKDSYALDKDEKAERLWKILLKRKGIGKSLDELYNEVLAYLQVRGAQLVGKETFEDHWINSHSKSLIPREKRSFYLLCEYLGLPSAYYTIMVRLKNVETQNSRSNSRQMNSLLSDLINAGCFNDDAQIHKILSELKFELQNSHALNEIGFYNDTLIEDLKTLVEILKPYLKLVQIEGIELHSI